jgi:hypothetical protein
MLAVGTLGLGTTLRRPERCLGKSAADSSPEQKLDPRTVTGVALHASQRPRVSEGSNEQKQSNC